jgi:cell division septum initiation protein DivIVA
MPKEDALTDSVGELVRLRQENEALRAEIATLEAEIETLRHEADLDSCHAAGLSAQTRAIIAEGDACPNKAAHPLLERVTYIDARNGETITRTRSYPLYREAFDAEAEAAGIEDPERFRA